MKRLWLVALPLLVNASDLKEMVQAVQSNELVKSLSYAVEAQQAVKGATISGYLPKLVGSGVYQIVAEDQRSMMDYDYAGNLEASAILFDGFRREHTLMAQDQNIQSAQENYAHQKESLTLNAIKLYFSMKSTLANIDAKQQKREQLVNEVERMEKFFNAGSISEDKLEQIKASLAMTEYELTLLRQNYQDMAFSMQTLTGKKIDSIGEASLVDIDAPYTHAPLTHELQALMHNVEALGHESITKTAAYWPSLLLKDTFQATHYFETDTSSIPANMSFLADLFSFPATSNKLQLQASMTLFDFFSKSQERQASQMQKMAKESELAYKKRDLSLKQQLSLIELRTIKSKIVSSSQSLVASQKSYEFIDKRFKANLVDSSTYLDALTQFYQSKAMLAAAQNEYQVALANYYFNHAIPLMEKIK
ncbi:MAG: hypothetical protein KU28_01480 [Sulfurovum sp. PC08-66]|nr:MAG: hypothetical protein KU28_01480 [Sulfurovum sp. PC08-66]KIM12614.1 MAG: hypothetical protein KU37_01595 [Sulfuricurvum sp. PC08-66]